VTLELGGKSPAVVMDGDLDAAARRLVQGKFLNAGQTCVAPDYVLTTPALQPGLVQALRGALNEFYGEDPASSADYGRIVNAGHFDRLTALLRDGTVAAGGRHDRATRYLEPTLLTGVSPDSALMQEEIFGPLLPVLTVPDLTSAVRFITARPTPLAAYLFSNSPRAAHRLRERGPGRRDHPQCLPGAARRAGAALRRRGAPVAPAAITDSRALTPSASNGRCSPRTPARIRCGCPIRRSAR
jgi:aldehyde dehydrogenase (NAD+)